MKANITAFRRLRKTDNNRVARATGATICSRTDEIQESDVGTQCGLFEVRKLGDEYFAFLEECDDPKACTLLLRGGSKDVLMEVERNLQDAMQVIRNVVLEPRLLPGGGAAEMAVSRRCARRPTRLLALILTRCVPLRTPWKSSLEFSPRTAARRS